jgi:rhomboid family protein
LKCPVCKVPTFVVEYLDIELDLCPDCNGVWFDRGELELLLGSDNPVDVEAAETEEKLRHCPLCPRKMEKMNIGPGHRVLIDTCPDGCGLWFDGNELSELTHDLSNEGWHVRPEVREFLGGMFPD